MADKKIKQFIAKPYKVGNSHAITVPAYNIKAGTVDADKKYKVDMEEIEDEEDE